MKLSKQQLKQIIKEEIGKVLQEDELDTSYRAVEAQVLDAIETGQKDPATVLGILDGYYRTNLSDNQTAIRAVEVGNKTTLLNILHDSLAVEV